METDDTKTPLGLLGGESEFGNPIAPDAPPVIESGWGLREILKENLFKDAKNRIQVQLKEKVKGSYRIVVSPL